MKKENNKGAELFLFYLYEILSSTNPFPPIKPVTPDSVLQHKSVPLSYVFPIALPTCLVRKAEGGQVFLAIS